MLTAIFALATFIAFHGILFIAAWRGLRALVRRNREARRMRLVTDTKE